MAVARRYGAGEGVGGGVLGARTDGVQGVGESNTPQEQLQEQFVKGATPTGPHGGKMRVTRYKKYWMEECSDGVHVFHCETGREMGKKREYKSQQYGGQASSTVPASEVQ